MRMTTHRIIQVWSLLDTCESMAGVCFRSSEQFHRIGNYKGSSYQFFRGMKYSNLAERCRKRLQEANR